MPDETASSRPQLPRTNSHLRELIDEMMATIRAAAGRELWTPEERARCEADMARIMASVRERALAPRAGRHDPR
jgi:hypothetical protein